MSVTAHPSVELIASYANGALPAAPSLVLAAHLERCAQCRGQVSAYETVAGEMLKTLAPVRLDTDALTAAIGRLDEPHPPEPGHGRRPPSPSLPDLPAAVAAAGVGPRRWFGLGRWVAPVAVNRVDDWRVFLLRGPAGARMPIHAHVGPEVTCVLTGAYRDGAHTYRAGDFSEAAVEQRHRIEVTDEGPCISIIARKGPMRTGPIMAVVGRFLGV